MSIFNQEIPAFEIQSVHDVDTFMEKNSLIVSKLILFTIEEAVEEDLLELPVFRLCVAGLTTHLIKIERNNFVIALEKCLHYLEEAEEFELCAKAVKLLKDDRLK